MHRRLPASVLLTLTIFLGWAAAADAVRPNPPFTVSVYNDAGVPAAVLERAEQEAASIFAHSGLQVVWLDCTPPGTRDAFDCNRIDAPGHFALRVISRAAGGLSTVAFGVSFLSPGEAGKYADVFWDRTQDLHAASNLDLGSILGSVMAHEIGHLLLGSNAHAVSGIMRAHWQLEELRRIAMGTLLFTSEQAELIRARARGWDR
jgi:hypothetical protein